MRSTLLTLLLIVSVGFSAASTRAQRVRGDRLSTAATVDSEAPPASFVLSPAYPNPFVSSTRFTVTASERQHVRVEVFNMLGRQVKTLFEGVLPGGTSRTFRLEAGNLPNGLYLYRVTGPHAVATRRVTLLQ